MPDLFDTAFVRDETEHWDSLAKRVAANTIRQSKRDGFAWLARSHAVWVAASLLLAVALMSMLARTDKSSERSGSVEWRELLAPADDVGRAIVLPNAPPAIGALLLDERGGA